MTSSDVVITKAQTIEDLKEIYLDRGEDFKSRYIEWLETGWTCFKASDSEGCFGSVWFNPTQIFPLEFSYYRKLVGELEASIVDAYVLKDRRGKGVYRSLWQNALIEAKKNGIKTLYGAVLNKNLLSMRVHYKLGMRDVIEILYYAKILWFKFHYLKKLDAPKDLLSIKKIKLRST